MEVSVHWKNYAVFAGETVECTITFTNTSNSHLRRSTSPRTPQRDRWKDGLPAQGVRPSSISSHRLPHSTVGLAQPHPRTHKSSFSLNEANGSSGYAISPDSRLAPAKSGSSGERDHRRSVSIVSIGSDAIEEAPAGRALQPRARPHQAHGRALSMQIIPKRNGLPSPGPSSAPSHDRAFTVPSPMLRSPGAPAEHERSRSTVKRTPTSPASGGRGSNALTAFQFPPIASALSQNNSMMRKPTNTKVSDPLRRALSPQPPDHYDQSSSMTKVLSPGSVSGTPRSSGEFYTISNNSSETLASEYVPQETSKMLKPPAHSRQSSSLGPLRMPKAETLMMGYVQITGSFTLDGSLINQSPFEEVKRKAIVGGQGGGGLVRTQSTKRDSGILSSMGWGNLGETFGGLLGDGGISSMKDTKTATSTKTIPILSAPQSILFVDLQLGPGESKTYSFSHPLPSGIPPSHRGKAMKTNYNLVVGTQRASKAAQHNQVQRVEVPFRVLPSISGSGEVLGHDLMTPHVILSNKATVISIENLKSPKDVTGTGGSRPTSGSSDFVSYLEKLLENSQSPDNAGLLSPTEDESRMLIAPGPLPASMKEAIDLAILNYNFGPSARRNVNRFEITRSKEKVAVIMLSRPAYRLGETIPVAIDFRNADVTCYTLHATLETSETIDPSIALRSKASVQRVTRRVHASHHESTISSHRVLFNPMIPVSATPEFITTGVNLEWYLRFEFVTERSGAAEELDEDFGELMEEVARDERGTVKAAVQGLYCETFDVAVPLRVYGATAALEENADSGTFPI